MLILDNRSEIHDFIAAEVRFAIGTEIFEIVGLCEFLLCLLDSLLSLFFFCDCGLIEDFEV